MSQKTILAIAFTLAGASAVVGLIILIPEFVKATSK